ncbi:hypothetical protein Tco_0486187, partial [Tanacetum coccineum]
MRNSGYGFVPIKSTQMASKILEHLERTSPKEKPSSSRLAGTTEKLATKLTSNLAQGAEQNRDTHYNIRCFPQQHSDPFASDMSLGKSIPS